MTTTTERPAPGRLRGLLGTGVGIAVAMAVMNVATYGFQIASAHLLGPAQYGGVAGLMAMLMIVAVVQLGLQATAARRISASPEHVAQIERVVMRVSYRAALVVGLVLLVASPLVWRLLVLDSIAPVLFLAVAAVPLTVMGGQAGILQGERRWYPLAALYLAVGVPRVLIGVAAIVVRPTEGAAMFGVMLGLFAPALVGWLALRRPRQADDHGADHSADHTLRPVLRETVTASVALLAFFVLSNMDIVVARNVLDDREAGLYAAGLILTKAVLFLPQFVVVVAFPAMSTVAQRRRSLLRSLILVTSLGAAVTLGVVVLAGLALVFVGGQEYADVRSELWLFAVLGTLLSLLQLLVYSVLARQGTRSAYLVWLAVVAILVLSPTIGSLVGLVLAVTLADATLFAVLLALSLRRMRADVSPGPALKA